MFRYEHLIFIYYDIIIILKKKNLMLYEIVHFLITIYIILYRYITYVRKVVGR